MAAKDPSIFEVFTIKSADGERSVDVKGGVINFSYFEDVYSPMVTATVLIASTGNVMTDEDGDRVSMYNGLPLRGGERVSIKIPANSSTNRALEFSKEKENELFVSAIGNVLIDAESESFTLNLVSREAITNETSRVGKKFPSTEPISDSVKEIIEKYLLSKKQLNIDETMNLYGFLGNMKKPFTILTWLATKSVPGNSSGQSASAGYFFYETQDGFNFKSVDTLVTQEPFPEKYTYSPGIVDTQDPNADFKILQYNVTRNQNLISNLERGAYCTYRMYFNPLTFEFTNTEQGMFKVSDYAEKMENLGEDFKIDLPPVDEKGKTLGDIPSRYMTGTIDIGVTEKAGKNSRKKNAEPMEYKSQAMMRYNTIFTNNCTMTIPLNTNLVAGALIECQFAKITTDQDKVIDTKQSGLYMIKELVHFYESDGSYTKLKLIKDTFGKRVK